MTEISSQESSYIIAEISQKSFRIELPYSISNVVFIQAFPFWTCIVVSLFGLIINLMDGGDNTTDAILACLAVGAGAWIGLTVFKHLLWLPAFKGYKAAIVVLYVVYLPVMIVATFFLLYVLAVAAFVSSSSGNALIYSSAVQGNTSTILVELVVISIVGLVVTAMLIGNMFEKSLWTFARLNGRCPACRRWRFGPVRRPMIRTCEDCGATLNFVRADDEEKAKPFEEEQ